MSELLPCPFCGGKASRQDIDYETCEALPQDENYGGSFIECETCGACSAVHFDRKENLYNSWNRRVDATAQSSKPVDDKEGV